MSMDFRYFTDVMDDIVDKARVIYDPIVGSAPNQTGGVLPIFRFGSYLELVEASKIADNNQATKYPLVWLIWDGNESNHNYETDQLYTISPRLFICTGRHKDETTSDCITNYFKPILYPIWAIIQEQMFYHENIESYVFNKCTIIEHPFWGDNYRNELFDCLSAIEIKLNNLRVMKIC